MFLLGAPLTDDALSVAVQRNTDMLKVVCLMPSWANGSCDHYYNIELLTSTSLYILRTTPACRVSANLGAFDEFMRITVQCVKNIEMDDPRWEQAGFKMSRALEWSSCIPCFNPWDDRSGGRPPVAGFKDYGESGDWSGNQSLGAIEPRQHPFDSIYIEKLGCPNPQQVLSYPGYFCQGSRWEGADLVHFGGHPGYPGLIIFFIFFHPWEICWIMMSPGSHVPCVLNALNCVVWVYGIGRIHCFPQGKTNTNLNNYKRNSHVNTNTSESES